MNDTTTQGELNPSELLDRAPMQSRQWLIVLLCIGLMALDGYDVLAISFALPGMTAEWGLSNALKGIILPLELLGMAVGAIFMGSLADNKGRKPVILISLVIVTTGMLVAGLAPNVYILGIARVFTGIGVGGILATSAPTASDFCNAKNRAFAVVLDWRVTFYLGAAVGAVFIPVIYFFIPETISHLTRSRCDGALDKIRKTFQTLGHTPPENMGKVINETKEIISPLSLFSYRLFWQHCNLLLFRQMVAITHHRSRLYSIRGK